MKEFWIAPKINDPIDPVEASYYYAYDEKGDPTRLEIHVIEYAAYERLQKQNEILIETLRYIASDLCQQDNRDSGKEALEALKKVEDVR